MTRLLRRELLERSFAAAAAAAAAPLAAPVVRAAANDTIRIAVIGVRGRGGSHTKAWLGNSSVEVAALVDADTAVAGNLLKAVEKKQGKKPAFYQDARKMLEDKSIDAVSIATCNHTHSLFAIWAMQAGKHVYVEKPVSHNIFEGRKVVEAARKYKRICQHGTQSRSSKGLKDAMAFLHGGGIGKIKIARGMCYKRRKSIGNKPDGTPPPSVDYNLWLGPAPTRPFSANRFHYNWHWHWDYGNGDIGNQGVHEMDRARWGIQKDTLPTKVMSVGGRFGYEDDGETPNTLVSWMDYGDVELIFEVRGLDTDAYKGGRIAAIFHGEKGYMVNGSYSGASVHDNDGKKIKSFGGGGDHFGNFIDAVKANDPKKLNAEIEEGHLSAALCHLANISYRLGEPKPMGDKVFGDIASANETYDRMKAHLGDNKVDLAATKLCTGPMLTFDPKTEKFTGNRAAEANKLVTREYRKPFVVPDQV